MKREIIKVINTVKPRNFVQQHVMMFNKSVVFADKKSMFKRGYTKHKVNLKQCLDEEWC
jgi:hypothetical protein